jgi:hypothetical protein
LSSTTTDADEKPTTPHEDKRMRNDCVDAQQK